MNSVNSIYRLTYEKPKSISNIMSKNQIFKITQIVFTA